MDEIVLQKTASIERCLKRVEEEYKWAGEDFGSSFTHQDAAILNLQRACEQSIDLSNYIINLKKWGVPSTSRESFDILVKNGLITSEIGEKMKKMVGFRNIAVHEYGSLNVDILKEVITKHLKDFKDFSQMVISADV